MAITGKKPAIVTVTVRWLDSFLETFECREVRYSSRMLWMILENGQERLVPLQNVRWFSNSRVSRQKLPLEDGAGIMAEMGGCFPDFQPGTGSVKIPPEGVGMGGAGSFRKPDAPAFSTSQPLASGGEDR